MQYNAIQYNAPQYNAPHYNAPIQYSTPSQYNVSTQYIHQPPYNPYMTNYQYYVPQASQLQPKFNATSKIIFFKTFFHNFMQRNI
jgi:hypothetical protein